MPLDGQIEAIWRFYRLVLSISRHVRKIGGIQKLDEILARFA